MRAVKSLRARMTLGFAASYLGVVATACAIDYSLSRHAARREAKERVVAAARLIAHEWEGDTSAPGIQRAIEYSRDDANRHGWRDALDDISLAVVDEKGRLLGASRYPHPPWPLEPRGRWIAASERGKAGIVVAGTDGHLLDSQLHNEAMLLLGFALLSTPIVSGAAWVLVGRTLRPIGALADQANLASADPLRSRLTPSSDDAEVRLLVSTLNGLLDRLSANTRLREQFYAAAAHELRTPLTVLSASIEVALSRPRSEEDYRETLADLQEQIRRLNRLAEDLLALNRLDVADNVPEERESVDLGDLCRRTLALLAPTIQERHLTVIADLDAPADVLVSLEHVAILTRNLLENAVRYASLGGTVSVSLSSVPGGEPGSLQLDICNDYALESPQNLERWFEPFYRADPSRSSATGGNGLGLAICRRIADSNRWDLRLTSDSQGICVRVSFPLECRRSV